MRAEALDHHAEQVRALVRAFFAGLEHLKQQPDDALARIAPRLEMSPRALRQSYSLMDLPDARANRDWLAPPEPRLTRTATRLIQLMRRWRLLDGAPDIGHLAEPGFLPQP